MSQPAVARRYARAVCELALSQGCLPSVAADLEHLRAAFLESPALARTLASPSFTKVEQRGLLQRVLTRMQVNTITSNFLMLMLDKRRIAALPEVCDEVRSLDDKHRGRLRVEVRSASALDILTIEALKFQVRKSTGKSEILMNEVVDPTLLGGIVTRIGDLVLDGSVRTRLVRMRRQLILRETPQA